MFKALPPSVLLAVVLCLGAVGHAQTKKPTAKTPSCRTDGCHAAVVEKKITHGPVAQGKCMACHEYDRPKQHTFKLVEDETKLCASCHGLQLRTVVHKPVKQGQCTSCHDPHGSDYSMILKADPARGLCNQCHEKEGFANKKFQHGPVAAGACILCHEPHSSWQPKLLVAKPQQLCQTCHNEVDQSRTDQMRHLHKPFAEGRCADCHDPHASDIRSQLRQDTPGLCLSCHDKLKKQLDEAPIVHGAVTQAGGCLGCHAPHGSAQPSLLRQGQTQMCLSCHDKPIKTPEGKTLTDMATLLKDNPDHHGPIREGLCSACHQPHTAERHNLLVKEYPPEFYAPFEPKRYELCFSCHQSQLVRDKQGRGLTRFRKDDVNLHWLHVNRKKGRTCRACHEVHASKNPFHIRDAVPFGDRGWLLELRYEQTPTGGRCSPGCHDPQSYDYRQTDNEEAADEKP